MKKVLGIHEGKSYLPELIAYQDYFKDHNDIRFIDSYRDLNNDYDLNDFDIHWYFPGMYLKRVKAPTIHEYTSLSTGSFVQLKNFLKKSINARPDHRLFLNEKVQTGFNFTDNIPTTLRDMGVSESFFHQDNVKKEFDFLYCGSVSSARGVDGMLENFKQNKNEGSLLIIGAASQDILNRYRNCKNINFAGQIPYRDVPKIAATCTYGINIIPDLYPFNIQASTKLLEYCALGLKIVTTKYQWVSEFMQRFDNANFFFLNSIDSALRLDELSNYLFETPNVECLKWNQIIQNTKIEELLHTL